MLIYQWNAFRYRNDGCTQFSYTVLAESEDQARELVSNSYPEDPDFVNKMLIRTPQIMSLDQPKILASFEHSF